MRRKRRLILAITCCTFVALSALLLLQSAGLVRPLGVGWGDNARARAYTVALQGPIEFRTASGVKQPPPGKYEYGVQSLTVREGLGIFYQRFDMTAGRAPQSPVLGTYTQLTIAPGWPVLISLILCSLWVMLVIRQRRLARDGNHCQNCGYDLRATPDRCPECGMIPAAPAPRA
jgi:hypothetical protein